MRDRVAGLRDLPENHDVAKAVRTAQFQALERLVRDYRDIGRPEWSTAPHTRPDIFFERSLKFCGDTVGRCLDSKVKLNLEVTEPLARAIDGILGEPIADLADQDLSGASMAALGSSGADCERLVRGARRRARAASREMVLADLLDEIGGTDDRSAEDLWISAVHEAGHAVVAHALRPGAVQSVSIHATADRGGGVAAKTSNSVYVRMSDVRDRLMLFLAGRAAEHEVFGTPTSGAGGHFGSDLAQATGLAATADASLGFDDAGGLVWRGVPEVHLLPKTLAADAALAERIRVRLDDAYEETRKLIRHRLAAVHALAKVLVARRILDGAEAEDIVRRHLVDRDGRP